jgi:hypothetical protein
MGEDAFEELPMRAPAGAPASLGGPSWRPISKNHGKAHPVDYYCFAPENTVPIHFRGNTLKNSLLS